MDALAADEIFLFEGFRLDLRAGGLFRADGNGVLIPVAIGSRALDLLILLVRRHGELVSKDEIMAAVWPGVIIEDSNLPTQISALRRVLDRGRSQGSCIQTVAGRGYRFVAAVTCLGAEATFVASPEPREAIADLPGSISQAGVSRARLGFGLLAAAAVGAAIILAVGALWLRPTSTTPQAADAASIAQPLVAPRLSVVVLPFANLSKDPDQQYFTDGMTDDLTTDLSRIADLLVIARNTAFTYRDKPADAKQIGRELSVRYVLEGSVQRSGNRVRINSQLIDAETGAHLWAERFDRDTSDLFALQNEITTRIAVALNLELLAAESVRPAERPTALDLILRGRAAFYKPPTRESYADAMGLFERALTLNPGSADAKGWLASVLLSRVLDFGSSSEEADIKRAEKLATEAVAASPGSALAHVVKAKALRVQRRCHEAIPEYETALALNRNWVDAIGSIGRCKIYTGPIEEGIAAQERSIRLSPRDPAIWIWYFRIGEGRLLQSRIDDAILWLEKARNANPVPAFVRLYLASAYALKGEDERAAAELAEARRLSSDSQRWSVARFKAATRYEAPDILALAEATYYAGLRKAGVPE